MIIHAYPEMYVHKAQVKLGTAFDFAIHDCHVKGDDFISYFIVSPTSHRMETGDVSCLLGKSGIEIALDVLEEATGRRPSIEPSPRYTRSPEYWMGWAVAYYQWYSGRNYSQIFQALPYEVLCQMYLTLHEADISKFVDIASQRVHECFPETQLKYFRTSAKYTQQELAHRSDVSLRSIQMYEQRRKDINKASADTLYRLSKVLHCSIEDLMEPTA